MALPDGQGGEVEQECRICDSLGEIRQSTTTIPFDARWIESPPIYDLSYITQPLPLFFPGS